MVSFGGHDQDNYTGIALDALQRIRMKDVQVDVVVGVYNPNQSEIEKACAKRLNTRFLCQPNNMADLMSKADIALGGGGIATWERCCLGLPTIAIVMAENQRQMINIFDGG